MDWTAIAIWAVVFGLLGLWVGSYRGRASSGLWLGAGFGPLGLLIVALQKDLRPRCPSCQGVLPLEPAVKCMHCGGDVPPAAYVAYQAANDGVSFKFLRRKPRKNVQPKPGWNVAKR